VVVEGWDEWDRWDRGLGGVRIRVGTLVRQAGVIGDGIEIDARSHGNDFACLLHAQQHLAPGFGVVAGGAQDVFDAVGSGTVVQEAQNGLPMQRADRTGAQARERGAIRFAEPVEGRDALRGGEDLVGQQTGLGAEGVFGRDEQAGVLSHGVRREEQATASHFQQWGGRGRGERGGRGLLQGAGEQDGTVGLMGQFEEGGQAARETSNGTGGIQDDQAGVEAADGGGQVIQVLGEREAVGDWTRSVFERGTQEQDVGRVAPGGFQARFNGVGGRVIGGEEEDVALWSGCAVRKWGAAGDAGGQGEGEEGETAVGGGIEQGEVTKGDATGPQPAEGLAGHVREQEEFDWGGSRGASRLGRHAWEGGGGDGEIEGAFELVQEVVIDGFEGHGEGPFRVIE